MEVSIDEPVILLKIPRLYRPDMSDAGVLEVTHRAWVLGPRREKAQYALAIYDNEVKGVYSIKRWFKDELSPDRWAFEGERAGDHVRSKYINKSALKYTRGTYGVHVYVNC